MSEKQGIKEGPPIWVESLMTSDEWRERYKKFLLLSLKSLLSIFQLIIKEEHGELVWVEYFLLKRLLKQTKELTNFVNTS